MWTIDDSSFDYKFQPADHFFEEFTINVYVESQDEY